VRQLSLALRFRHAHPPRTFALLCLYAAAIVVVACSSDFPNEPDSPVTLETVDWPSELHVTDVDTIEIRLRFRDSPQEITGLRLRWQSSNDDVLRVVQLQAPEGGSREDTLVAQRRAVVTARSSGPDTVHVIVDAGGGFEPAESTYVIRVTQKWVAVSAGRAHTCGLTVDSLAYCWGEGSAGKLGSGRPLASTVPVLVLGLGDLRFIAVSAGQESSCGIIREGAAFCWGSNDEGRLGNGDPFERSQFIPAAVSGPAFKALDVGRVVCGVADGFTAQCWGGNADGQLGHFGGQPPPLDQCLNNNPKGCSRTPRRVSPNDTTPVFYESVTVGGHHSCGISQAPDTRLAFCWGTGPFGALGSATTTASATPIRVAGGLQFVAISGGGDHTCGITTASATYCWGLNADGELGNGTTSDSRTPAATAAGVFSSVTAGGRHSCALTAIGEAFCWGLGSSGQLGNGSADLKLLPVKVSGGLRFEGLSSGELHTCGVVSGGSLYCWGEGAGGRLGTGDEQKRLTPTRVAEP